MGRLRWDWRVRKRVYTSQKVCKVFEVVVERVWTREEGGRWWW